MPSTFRSLLLIASLFAPLLLSAQNRIDSRAPVTPSLADPIDFLKAAAKVNGLEAENIGPWHLKATWVVLDPAGKVQDSGTFEAFWQSPLKYKFIYKSPGYDRTIWSNESGSYATSNPKWPGDVEWMIRRSLFDISPDPRNLDTWTLRFREATAGVQLKCVDWVPKNEMSYAFPNSAYPFYCFDFDHLALRSGSEVLQRYQAIFNNIVSFRGAYIPSEVELMHASVPYFRLHIDKLESLTPALGDPFVPDAGAKPISRRFIIDSDIRSMHATREWGVPHPWDYRLHRPLPLGREIIVQVLVNAKGKVSSERCITGGDPQMQFRAAAAASRWEFEPYFLDGVPVEFYTELEFY